MVRSRSGEVRAFARARAGKAARPASRTGISAVTELSEAEPKRHLALAAVGWRGPAVSSQRRASNGLYPELVDSPGPGLGPREDRSLTMIPAPRKALDTIR